jgi:hypothetical protein
VCREATAARGAMPKLDCSWWCCCCDETPDVADGSDVGERVVTRAGRPTATEPLAVALDAAPAAVVEVEVREEVGFFAPVAWPHALLRVKAASDSPIFST